LYSARARSAWSGISEGFHHSLGGSVPAPDANDKLGSLTDASFEGMLDEVCASAPPARGGAADASDADGSLLDEIATPPQQREDLYRLLSLQGADGSFGWDDAAEDLWEEAGLGSREFVEANLVALGAGPSRERIVQTVLVLLLLARRFADRERLWRRAYRKASRQFLAKALGQEPAQVDTWLERLAAAL
jgi:hypothetical protein